MPLQPAILGTARLANFRLGYEPAALATIRRTRVSILVNGIEARTRVRVDGLVIHDALNDTPNTCQFTIDGTAPIFGQTVRVLINSDTPRLLFNGQLQTVDLSYEGRPTQLAWQCVAIDDTARLNQIRPYGIWSAVSATTVAQDLITRFAPGFTATHVQASLPAVSVNFDTTEGFGGCLTQIAKLIGGYWYVEDLDLHLFQTEATDLPDDIDTTPGRFLDEPAIAKSTDYSQLRTRVYGRGGGSTTSEAIPVGAIEIPVDSVGFYVAGGGMVTTGPQRITYAQMLTGETTAHGAEVHVSPYTTVAARPVPASAPIVSQSATASGVTYTAGNYQFKSSFGDGSRESLPSPASNTVTLTGLKKVTFSNLIVGPTGIVARLVYYAFSASGTPDWTNLDSVGGWATVGDNIQTALDIAAGGGFNRDPLAAPDPYVAGATSVYVADTAIFSSAGGTAVIDGQAISYTGRSTTSGVGALTGIPASGSGSIIGAIRVGAPAGSAYAAGSTALPVTDTAEFVATGGSAVVAGQTITYTGRSTSSGVGNLTGIPATGLGSIAFVVGGGDLIQAFYPAGATSIAVEDTATFSATGGSARIAGFTFTYTGRSTSSGVGNLTGIPASGPGSLSADVLGGAPILVGASGGGVLSGIPASGAGSVVYAITQGENVDIWVQRDDLAAQALYGIHEGPPLVDGRRATPSVTARCDAELVLFSTPIVTVTYASRDVKTKSGKPIVFNLTSPAIAQTLTIQDVTITEIDVAPGTAPRFTVTASSVRFSLEDILRKVAA